MAVEFVSCSAALVRMADKARWDVWAISLAVFFFT